MSRNWCLSRFISRLASRISDLEAKGWEFETENRNGDYVYKVKRDGGAESVKAIYKTCDVDEAMRGVVNKLRLFDLKSIELMNAYKAWQKAKPEAKESCKGTFVILYNRL